MSFVRSSCCFAMVALLLAAPSAPVRAAGSDLGYDAVTKFLISQDAGTPAPGSFAADFAAASVTQKAPSGHMPFGLGKIVSSMQNVGTMMKNGTAQRRYIGSTKFRDDDLTTGTGDLTDCTARTITHIDFNAKTYHVTSMDQPAQPQHPSSGRPESPGPAPTDDGTKIALAITSKSLGPLTIDGVPTNGYLMNIKMTITRPTGETATTNEELTSYYSGTPEPFESCPGIHFSLPSGSSGGSSAGANSAAMAQMRTALAGLSSKGDSRFKVTTSGPPVPSGKLALWQMMRMKGADESAGGFGGVTERGNVHSLSDSDPAFSVPAGFSQV